jgi:hypothetical protein
MTLRSPVEEVPIGPIPRLVVRGSREEGFRALGAHAAAWIRAVTRAIPDLPHLRSRLTRRSTRAQFDAVAEASRAQYSEPWADLEALADAADADFEELLLLNLRGDLGAPGGAGCSDLAWRHGDRSFIAHNEDEYPVLREHCRLLILKLDGEPSVITWWTPGFLPANTWAITSHGLVYTIDHLNVVDPKRAPGRLFVARAMQRAATVDEAAEFLHEHPSAGGFTYTLGQLGSGSVTVVEAAAGECAASPVDRSDQPRWHTNHVRYLRAGLDAPLPESRRRGDILGRLAQRAIADSDWFASVLRTPLPEGVQRDGHDGDALATHSTIVIELTSGAVTLMTTDGSATTSAEDLLSAPQRTRV